MALSDKDRDLLWSAVYAVVIAYENGEMLLERAKDIVEVICTGTAVMSDPEED